MIIHVIEYMIIKYYNKAAKYINFVKQKIIWNNIFKKIEEKV